MAPKKNIEMNAERATANAASSADTPVRTASPAKRSADAKASPKSSTAKKAVSKEKPSAAKAKKTASKTADAKKPAAKKAVGKTTDVKKAAPKKAASKTADAKKPTAKKVADAKKPAEAKKPADAKKPAAKKPAAKKAVSKTADAKKPAAKKSASKSAAEKKGGVKKTVEKSQPAAKKAADKKPAAKKATGNREVASKETAAKKTSARKKVVEADVDVDVTRDELSTEEGRKKRKYTRRGKKAPVPVPKYQGKQGLLVKKKGDPAAPLKPRVQKQYSSKDLDYFRAIIVQKIHDANEELMSIEERLNDSSSGEFSEDSTYSLHMADQGTDAMEREKAYLFAARERKFISHLTDALQRIKSGNYGICIVCSNLIEKGRLEAVPHARMCVNCKQETKAR